MTRTAEDYYHMHRLCARCGKSFVTDNAWIVCRWPPDDRLTVEAYFCSGACRAHYLIDKGWRPNALNCLRPPGHPDLEEA